MKHLLIAIFLALILASNAYGSVFSFAPRRALDLDPSNTVITNSVTETTIYTFSISANTLATANQLRLKVISNYVNTTAGDDNVTLRLKYGATTLVAVVANLNAGEASAQGVHALILLGGDGATNSQVGYINVMVGESDNNGSGNSLLGTAAEDSTGALTLEVTAQLSVASTLLTFTKHHAVLTLAK